MNRREYLLDIKKIQKSLVFLSNQLNTKNYDYRNLEIDIKGYLQELQFNHRIPDFINLKEAVIVEKEDDNDLHIYFSKPLEDYITDSGKYIIPEMLDS